LAMTPMLRSRARARLLRSGDRHRNNRCEFNGCELKGSVRQFWLPVAQHLAEGITRMLGGAMPAKSRGSRSSRRSKGRWSSATALMSSWIR
jgi:hypothetical protein